MNRFDPIIKVGRLSRLEFVFWFLDAGAGQSAGNTVLSRRSPAEADAKVEGVLPL
jgi:hypothetical protein